MQNTTSPFLRDCQNEQKTNELGLRSVVREGPPEGANAALALVLMAAREPGDGWRGAAPCHL